MNINDCHKYMSWQSWQTESIIKSTHSADTNTTNLIENIADSVTKIYKYGIGYNDVLSTIAIPLIIALFAFSFPFMFERINHINNKYSSSVIAKLFEDSWQYKFFLYINIIAILYMLFAGGVTLWKPETVYTEYENAFIGILWCVSLTYAVSVLLLARLSILFNKPDKLLEIIKSRYRIDVLKAKWMKYKIQTWRIYRWCRYPSDREGHNKFKSIIRTNLLAINRYPDEQMLNRYIEVAKYAIKENNFSLYISVQDSLEDIFEKERKAVNAWSTKDKEGIEEAAVHYESMRYFENILKAYSSFDQSSYSNETIIFKLLGIFNKTMYMNYVDSYKLALCIRIMIDGKKFSFLETYIDYSRYYFNFINRLPQLLYIKGANNQKRPEVEKKSEETWNQLCNFHYLLAAYAFHCKHYSLLPSFMDKKSHLNFQLYPNSHIDILLRYANCMENLRLFSLDKLFTRKVNINEMLMRYTCALFMLTKFSNEKRIITAISPKLIKTLQSCKNDISKYELLIKEEEHLNRLNPGLKSFDFNNEFDRVIKEIEDSDKWFEEIENEPKPIQKLFKCIFPSIYKPKENKEVNVYTKPLNKTVIDAFEQRFNNIQNDIINWHLSKYLFSSIDEKHIKSFDIGACQLVVNKIYFIDSQFNENYWGVYNQMVELMSTRIAYLILSAFSEMKIYEVDLVYPDFYRFFNNYIGKNKSDYVLIDVDSPFNSLLNTYYIGHEREYKGVPFISLNSTSRIGNMSGLPSFEKLKGSLIIVAKKYLPSLVCESKKPTFEYKDESNKKEKRLIVRTTVNIHTKVTYNYNDATIIKINNKRLLS